LNDGARDPVADDIFQGLKLYRRAMLLLVALLAVLALA
jgi:adenosylcobinamide-phosphate synthase